MSTNTASEDSDNLKHLRAQEPRGSRIQGFVGWLSRYVTGHEKVWTTDGGEMESLAALQPQALT